jgi:phosphopantothenoylcysteine decarboxylase / phosphopantothenate---cysteine ligase
VGHLASGMTGAGRFPETATILAHVRAVLGRNGDLAGKRVIVTAGGTQEPLDPVRYIGNRSSGLMGFALAEEARDRGAEVLLILGAVSYLPPAGVHVESVRTAMEMRDVVLAAVPGSHALIMAAAVADYRVEHPADQKIKKGSAAESADGSLSIRLVRNPDILAEVKQHPGAEQLIRVGFAAETADLAANATSKLNSKGLHMLVANDVTSPGSGFGTSTNEVAIFHPDGRIEQLTLLPKTEVASAIWDRVAPLMRDAGAAQRADRGQPAGKV